MEENVRVITKTMEVNFALLTDLIETRKNKAMSFAAQKKYDMTFNNALNKFSYIVDMHTKRYKKYSNYEDLHQEGMIGLTYALLNFNPERSKNFFKLANWYIKTKIKRSANKHLIVSVPMHLAKAQQFKTQNGGLPIQEIIEVNVENIYEKEQIRTKMVQAIKCLNNTQQEIVCMHYGIHIDKNNNSNIVYKNIPPTSISKISKQFNLPRKNVNMILDEAYEILSNNNNIASLHS